MRYFVTTLKPRLKGSLLSPVSGFFGVGSTFIGGATNDAAEF